MVSIVGEIPEPTLPLRRTVALHCGVEGESLLGVETILECLHERVVLCHRLVVVMPVVRPMHMMDLTTGITRHIKVTCEHSAVLALELVAPRPRYPCYVHSHAIRAAHHARKPHPSVQCEVVGQLLPLGPFDPFWIIVFHDSAGPRENEASERLMIDVHNVCCDSDSPPVAHVVEGPKDFDL
jgi:hypothetical protein